MLIDFLCSLRAVLKDELSDYDALCREIGNDGAFTALMPIIFPDFDAALTLAMTPAARYTRSSSIPKVFICPFGASDFFAKPYLIGMIREFYTDEELAPTGDEAFSYLLYRNEQDIEDEEERFAIEEMILLDSPALRQSPTVRPLRISVACEPTAVYIRLVPTGGKPLHLFLISDTPESVWTGCIEQFSIKTDMLIHAHKGIGDWFNASPLYEVMKKRRKPELLPKYYFRGKHISSNDAPDGSSLLETFEFPAGTECYIYTLPEKL